MLGFIAGWWGRIFIAGVFVIALFLGWGYLTQSAEPFFLSRENKIVHESPGYIATQQEHLLTDLRAVEKLEATGEGQPQERAIIEDMHLAAAKLDKSQIPSEVAQWLVAHP